VLARVIRRAEDAGQLVVVALVAFMVLPAYAFFNGHPFRMRYIVAPSVGRPFSPASRWVCSKAGGATLRRRRWPCGSWWRAGR
jgi:hypothetical protein